MPVPVCIPATLGCARRRIAQSPNHRNLPEHSDELPDLSPLDLIAPEQVGCSIEHHEVRFKLGYLVDNLVHEWRRLHVAGGAGCISVASIVARGASINRPPVSSKVAP